MIYFFNRKIGIKLLTALVTSVFIIGCSTSTFEKDQEKTGDVQMNANIEGDNLNNLQDNPVIVWLGDSLTQGSLGDDGDNYIGAPPIILKAKYGLEIEGYGFYGNTTNDVLWRYCDETQENQQIDPDKVYIFWLGLNDWVIDHVPNTDSQKVIDRLDNFIIGGKVDKYIVMGPTKRIELRETVNNQPMYDIINEAMKEHYGKHYMEVVDLISLDDFGPDGIHLKKETYEKVAEAVYKRLCDDGYIKSSLK